MIVREVLLVGESEQITAILALAVRRVPDVDRAGWSTQVCGVANKRSSPAMRHPSATSSKLRLNVSARSPTSPGQRTAGTWTHQSSRR